MRKNLLLQEENILGQEKNSFVTVSRKFFLESKIISMVYQVSMVKVLRTSKH